MQFHTILRHGCAISALSVSLLGSALAADPVPVDPARFELEADGLPDRWSGFYAGASLSGLALDANVKTGPGSTAFNHNEGIAMFGIHTGYNFARFGDYQSGGWMLGVEGDFAYGSLDSKKTDPVLGSVDLDGNFTASARLRAGYAWDSLYLYTTAGLALSDYRLKPTSNKDVDLTLGLTAGFGAEFAVNDVWTVRAEAIAYDFGEQKYNFNGTRRSVELNNGVIRFGISRRF